MPDRNERCTAAVDKRRNDTRCELRDLIDSGAVLSVFQPIVDLHRGRIIAYESLSRLVGTFNSFSNIGDVFDAAAREGLLWELERVTRRSSLHAAAEWPADILLFMNCSPFVFTDERFIDTLTNEIDGVPGVTPDRVVIEITERAECASGDSLLRHARRLKELGFRIAIDDVGAGTSGLNRIASIRPHWLKLDRELVDHVDVDPLKQNLLDFFIRFAHLSGVRMIAEGIERDEELRTLIDLGADVGQGYLLGRPGDRNQVVPRETSDSICRRADEALRRRGVQSTIDTLINPRQTCDVESPQENVAPSPGAASGSAGNAIVQPRRPVDGVTHASLDKGWDHRSPVGALNTREHVRATVDSTTPILDALRLIACREDMRDAEPLVVMRDGEIVGAMPVDKLILAAARGIESMQHSVSPLTGLPMRPHCEQVLLSASESEKTLDAVFIDVLGFHRFNETVGYEAGDLVLRILAGELSGLAKLDNPHDLIGHLGDDRFMVLQKHIDVLGFARALAEEFETATERFLEDRFDQIGSSRRGLPRLMDVLGLRLILIRDAARAANSPTDLLRMAAGAREQKPTEWVGRKSILIDGGGVRALKLTA